MPLQLAKMQYVPTNGLARIFTRNYCSWARKVGVLAFGLLTSTLNLSIYQSYAYLLCVSLFSHHVLSWLVQLHHRGAGVVMAFNEVSHIRRNISIIIASSSHPRQYGVLHLVGLE